MWRKRLALKRWTGWPTFPMIFVDQQLIGGNSDLKKLLAQNAI
jgi:monothiol glutaredoxin